MFVVIYVCGVCICMYIYLYIFIYVFVSLNYRYCFQIRFYRFGFIDSIHESSDLIYYESHLPYRMM